MLATNEYFSVGGGFVVSSSSSTRDVPDSSPQVNKETQTAENMYYMETDPSDATPARRDQTHGQQSLPLGLSGLPAKNLSRAGSDNWSSGMGERIGFSFRQTDSSRLNES